MLVGLLYPSLSISILSNYNVKQVLFCHWRSLFSQRLSLFLAIKVKSYKCAIFMMDIRNEQILSIYPVLISKHCIIIHFCSVFINFQYVSKNRPSLFTLCHTHFPLHHFTIQFYQLAYIFYCSLLFFKNKVLVVDSYQSQDHAFCV